MLSNTNKVQDPIYAETFGPREIYAQTTEGILKERGSRYGQFASHAEITQDLKNIMRSTQNWGLLLQDQKETLEMIAHKIGRILNGDPNYDDSWVDIAGYATLVANRLQGK